MGEPIQGFPEDAALRERWERLLSRAPRLRPWLAQMIARERLLIAERGGALEPALRQAAARWLRDFEKLPQFAVAAIATELADDRPAPQADPELPSETQAAPVESPERAAASREALLADPLFALAFHCIDVAVRPALDLSRVPEPHWFGLLHASARTSVQLDAGAAVALVLRLLGEPWMAERGRAAALRLFLASPSDLRAAGELMRLCAALPWKLSPAEAPAFVAAAARARTGLAEASALCARLAAAAGGLRHLELAPAAAPSAEELAQVRASIRRHPRIAGFRRLEALL